MILIQNYEIKKALHLNDNREIVTVMEMYQIAPYVLVMKI